MLNKWINTIQCGDSEELLKQLPENSIDSVVCDPPYELGFMGKKWDNTGIAYRVELWRECLRVLKPGGHLLSFGGTRTYHRMAVAIEDAGFEVRDMIEWVYGCLSEDTEILTESGYKPLRKLTQYDRIGVYDITNNIYKWERPQRYSVYKVHQDTAYRIKSDYTDQIVSRNHRCLVEREGKLVFITAEELNEVEYMPTLSEDFYSLQENSNRKLLLKELLWKGKGLAKKLFSKWTGEKMSEQRIEVRKEPSLERWSNLLEETRKLQADKICEVSEGVFTDGEKRWICNGTSFDNGSILGNMFRENPSSASYQSRPTGQPTGKPDVISIKQGTQITRRARVEKIEYSGIIFCPTVSTGAFIARRNGQVFITGNSGFPKSLNIGKKIDQLQGNEREITGENPNYRPVSGKEGYLGESNFRQTDGMSISTKGTSEWEGWGTATKPAHEPICMARKPLSEKTVAENVLKWGTGGINIDESRVGTDGGTAKGTFPNEDSNGIYGNGFNGACEIKDIGMGRFPANLILSADEDGQVSEEVRECFPETNTHGGGKVKIQKGHWLKGGYIDYDKLNRYQNDSGNASRFFRAIPQVVDYNDFLIYNRSILTNIKQLCGQHSTKKKTDIILDGVIKEAEKFIQDAELLIFGNSKMEKFLTDTASTTKTLIAQMTELKTLNVLPSWLIMKFTEDYEKTIKLLKELNTEDVKNAESINHLIAFKREMLELIRDIARNVVMGNSENGKLKTENESTLTPENTNENIKKNIGKEKNFKSIIYQAKASKSERNKGCEGLEEKVKVFNGQSDKPSEDMKDVEKRFTTLPKANNHPTVKPIALMEYLIKMVTPKGGIVLDPFAGSGSTLVASKQNGFQYIGIELDFEYCKIAEARIKSIKKQQTLI